MRYLHHSKILAVKHARRPEILIGFQMIYFNGELESILNPILHCTNIFQYVLIPVTQFKLFKCFSWPRRIEGLSMKNPFPKSFNVLSRKIKNN